MFLIISKTITPSSWPPLCVSSLISALIDAYRVVFPASSLPVNKILPNKSSTSGEVLLLANRSFGPAVAPGSVDSIIISEEALVESFIRCSSVVAVAAVLSFLIVTRDLELVLDESETRFIMPPVVRASAEVAITFAVVRESAVILTTSVVTLSEIMSNSSNMNVPVTVRSLRVVAPVTRRSLDAPS